MILEMVGVDFALAAECLVVAALILSAVEQSMLPEHLDHLMLYFVPRLLDYVIVNLSVVLSHPIAMKIPLKIGQQPLALRCLVLHFLDCSSYYSHGKKFDLECRRIDL
jgi:hypothetical protein